MKNRATALGLLLLCLCSSFAFGAKEVFKFHSPNNKLQVVVNQGDTNDGTFYMVVNAVKSKDLYTLVQCIELGLDRDDASFSKNLSLVGQSSPKKVEDRYTVIHGKRKNCFNDGNEVTFQLKNAAGEQMNLIVRAYNNGVCFRYQFPQASGKTAKITNEYTSYQFANSDERWLQPFVACYEAPFPYQKDSIKQGEWGYPALFHANGSWLLISEADMDRNYCATRLCNSTAANKYKIGFPSAGEGRGTGDVNPTITFPWNSPWRVVVAGDLKDIVETTLIEDVSKPCVVEDTTWIKSGPAAWIYWAYNHGTRDFKTVCSYIDLAAAMHWEYVLFDWEWDAMTNGGNLEDAARYARQKGVKPWIWYNSGGNHTWVPATPKDRMLTPEARAKEFAWLKSIGICGVKVDFFESDKQNMMNYYIDLMEDAAKYKMMINFHGCTVPRGWSRTYPNLMSMEAIYGAEQYNNAGQMTIHGAEWNTVFPFTRNIIGPMDYTPVAFTNSQHPHTTTYAHELALSTVFESGVQHWADRPEGFYNLPEAAKEYMSKVPTAWDDIKFIDGYPGKRIIVARKKGDAWYIAGINGTNNAETLKIKLSDYFPNKTYSVTLLKDGNTETEIATETKQIKAKSPMEIKWLPRGGFVMKLQ